ncbi:MAG: hypothetical protein R6U70_04970, partial [Bacillota bacterium]
MSEERPPVDRGRILAVRLGVNPNSSGHGIPWAALFFLPSSAVSVLLAAITARSLDRALRRHRLENQIVASPLALVVTPAIWGLTWTAVALSWSLFLPQVAPFLGTGRFSWFSVALMAAVGLPMTVLAHRCRRCAGLRRASLKSAAVALVGAGLLGAVYLGGLRGILWSDLPLAAVHMYF